VHIVFGDGKVGVIQAGTDTNGVVDVIILDPDGGPGVIGERRSAEEIAGRPFNLNSAVLQFKNTASVRALIGELQKVEKSLEQAEQSGWVAPDPWEVHLVLSDKPPE
jgi:hypothetical protein